MEQKRANQNIQFNIDDCRQCGITPMTGSAMENLCLSRRQLGKLT
jgi:hypothetical protein